MTSLSPAATSTPYLAYCCHVQKGRTTHLEIPPKPRVFSKSTLHTELIVPSFIGCLPAVTLGDPSWASLGGSRLPGRLGISSAGRLLATEEEQAR